MDLTALELGRLVPAMFSHTLIAAKSLECGQMFMLILGVVLLGLGGVLDSVFRRMSRIGQRWALLQGGAFDYSRYHKVREEHGWAAWPVYLLWVAWTCGSSLLIVGFFAYFGASPTHGK